MDGKKMLVSSYDRFNASLSVKVDKYATIELRTFFAKILTHLLEEPRCFNFYVMPKITANR